jgi:formate hydrogenlyase subunit 6/NADH:ubiquinone oxidoreductase subunit I
MCEEAFNTKPVAAIYMSQDYELAKAKRVDFMTDLGLLHEGHRVKEYKS